jgi:hypothetical protein
MIFGNAMPSQATALTMSLLNVNECFKLASMSWYEFHLHPKLHEPKKLKSFKHKSQGYYA